jgi:alkaline phosphatase
MTKGKKQYKLSEQAKLCVVGLFQKGLVLGQDVTDILNNLTLHTDKDEVCFSNPELCHMTEKDLEEAELSLGKQQDLFEKSLN